MPRLQAVTDKPAMCGECWIYYNQVRCTGRCGAEENQEKDDAECSQLLF